MSQGEALVMEHIHIEPDEEKWKERLAKVMTYCNPELHIMLMDGKVLSSVPG